MGMTVQHNITAMNANRNLGVTTSAQAKSTEKLSSGFKINRAADDAAGLTISEKMRKQVRGLTQASANAEDGISSVQTAEGALTEVHDMLQRMNELAVKAANGTDSKADRDAIQAEVDQLTTEIDRVAETTKFNEIYLLKGSEGKKTINLNPHDAGLKGKLVDNGDGTAVFTMDVLSAGDKTSIGGKEYTIGAEADTVKDKIKDGVSVTINGETYKVSGTDVQNDKGEKLYVKTADGSTAAAAFNDGVADFTTAAKFKNNTGADTNNTAVTLDNLKTLVSGGKTVTIGTTDYKIMTDANSDGIDDNDTSVITDKKAYMLAQSELLQANQIGDTEGNAAVGTAADPDTAMTLTTATNTFGIKVGKAQVANSLSFSLHVGADADMTNKIGVDIDVMNSANLGIKGIKVTDDSGKAGTYAIDAIADAVSKVSSQRSALGAVQNRLEHTIKNLDNVVENTAAAESAIRDTDMASEMVNFSKNNILAQAGQSMLAQANQSNQGVLSLLG